MRVVVVDIASLPIAVQNVANRGRTEMGEILDHDGRTPEHPCDRYKYFILAHYFYNILISTLKGCNKETILWDPRPVRRVCPRKHCPLLARSP